MLAPPVPLQQADMSSLLLLCFLPSLAQAGQVLAGYHFQDNLLEQRFGPQNGYTTFTTGRPIPDQVKMNTLAPAAAWPSPVAELISAGSEENVLVKRINLGP